MRRPGVDGDAGQIASALDMDSVVGDIEQMENDGRIVAKNDGNGPEIVSPDVMKVSDSGCEQPYIWTTTPDAQNTPKSGVLTSENGPNSTSGADGKNGQNATSEVVKAQGGGGAL